MKISIKQVFFTLKIVIQKETKTIAALIDSKREISVISHINTNADIQPPTTITSPTRKFSQKDHDPYNNQISNLLENSKWSLPPTKTAPQTPPSHKKQGKISTKITKTPQKRRVGRNFELNVPSESVIVKMEEVMGKLKEVMEGGGEVDKAVSKAKKNGR
jgi:hypothetical protein